MKTIITQGQITICLLLIFLGLSTTIAAQTTLLTLHRTDGKKVQYSYSEKPNIFFNDEYLFVKTANIETEYPISFIDHYTLNETEDPMSLKDIMIDNDTINNFYNATDIQNCNITYRRTFYNTEWQPLYVPFCIKYSQLNEFFEIAVINNFHQYDDDNNGSFDRTELEIRRVTEERTLMANYPYLIKAKETGTYKLNFPETTIYSSENYTIDCSSVELKYSFTGTNERINNLRGKGYYILENGCILKAYSSSQYIEPFRWYLTISARGEQFMENPIFLEANSIHIVDVNESTSSIENIVESPSSTLLERELLSKNVFNMHGQNVKFANEGLYIIMSNDGSIKKVFINN